MQRCKAAWGSSSGKSQQWSITAVAGYLMRAGHQQSISDLGIRGAHVELEAIWRLCHHLQRPLQNANWELICGLSGQPQPEVLQSITWFSTFGAHKACSRRSRNFKSVFGCTLVTGIRQMSSSCCVHQSFVLAGQTEQSLLRHNMINALALTRALHICTHHDWAVVTLIVALLVWSSRQLYTSS